MEKAEIEHKILVAVIAQRIREGLLNAGREYGTTLKPLGIDVKEFQLKTLDLIGEAYTLLKEEAKKAENK